MEEYRGYYGRLNERGEGVWFKNVGKGKYMVRVKGMVKVERKENEGGGKGEMRVVL